MKSTNPSEGLLDLSDQLNARLAQIEQKYPFQSGDTKQEYLQSIRKTKELLQKVSIVETSLRKAYAEERETNEVIIMTKGWHQGVRESGILAKKSYENLMNSSVDSMQTSLINRKYEITPLIELTHQINNLSQRHSINLEKVNSEIQKTNQQIANLEKIEGRHDQIESLKLRVYEYNKLKKELEEKHYQKMDISLTKSLEMSQIQKLEVSQREIKENHKKCQEIDVCFLIDGTFSMDDMIETVKEKVSEIIDKIPEVYPEFKYRIAVVIYRDFDMGEKSFDILEFIEDPSVVKTFLHNVKVTGGDDTAEDVNGGFQRVLGSLYWKSDTKLLIHSSDAPGHGLMLNDDEEDDDHPNPSTDKDWSALFQEIKGLGINYSFLRLSSLTQKMEEEFRKLWNEKPKTPSPGAPRGPRGIECLISSLKRNVEFSIHPITLDMKEFVITTRSLILDSIKRSIEINPRAEVTSMLKSHSITLTESMGGILRKPSLSGPNWRLDKVMWTEQNGEVTSFPVATIEEIISESKMKPIIAKCKIDIQQAPFEKGNTHNVFAAELMGTRHKLIVKERTIPISKGIVLLNLKKRYIAGSLSRTFNQALEAAKAENWAKLYFIFPFIFRNKENISLVEGYIGDYDYKPVKSFKNLDLIHNDEDIRHYTAFAHYTYQITKGKYLVTDLKGFGPFMLTDATIHSSTKEFKDCGDDGQQGSANFFRKHRCNDICKALRLSEVQAYGKDPNLWKEKVYDHFEQARSKCGARLCNREKSIYLKYCQVCSGLMEQTKTISCESCSGSVSYKENYYELYGLDHPKKCNKCSNNNLRESLQSGYGEPARG